MQTLNRKSPLYQHLFNRSLERIQRVPDHVFNNPEESFYKKESIESLLGFLLNRDEYEAYADFDTEFDPKRDSNVGGLTKLVSSLMAHAKCCTDDVEKNGYLWTTKRLVEPLSVLTQLIFKSNKFHNWDRDLTNRWLAHRSTLTALASLFNDYRDPLTDRRIDAKFLLLGYRTNLVAGFTPYDEARLLLINQLTVAQWEVTHYGIPDLAAANFLYEGIVKFIIPPVSAESLRHDDYAHLSRLYLTGLFDVDGLIDLVDSVGQRLLLEGKLPESNGEWTGVRTRLVRYGVGKLPPCTKTLVEWILEQDELDCFEIQRKAIKLLEGEDLQYLANVHRPERRFNIEDVVSGFPSEVPSLADLATARIMSRITTSGYSSLFSDVNAPGQRESLEAIVKELSAKIESLK